MCRNVKEAFIPLHMVIAFELPPRSKHRQIRTASERLVDMNMELGFPGSVGEHDAQAYLVAANIESI